VHGTAPDIAGKNLANPTALLLSGTMMLKSMGLQEFGNRIEQSVFKVMREGRCLTGDVGGKAKTSEYTKAVIDNL
jgi:isocitrate dehydrogenase (NAD+)